LIIITSCSPKRVNYNIDEEFNTEPPRRIAVIPFFKDIINGPLIDDLMSERRGIYFKPEDIAENADRKLTHFLMELLSEFSKIELIPEENIRTSIERHPLDPSIDSLYRRSLRIGREVNADAVFVGTISRYKDRKGSPAGSTSPASVVFSLSLIRVKDGKILWRANFGETQRSLLENILDIFTFIERGGKWLTADELARYGLREILKTLPF
jgi:hypothetical protein